MSNSAIPGRFSPLNRSEWLQKIEKDLRGKSLEDLNIHFGDSLSISPIQHLEDLPESEEIHLSFSRPRHKIPSAYLAEKDLKDLDNSLVLKMLNQGAGSLYLDLDNMDAGKEADLLRSVDTSLVDICFSHGIMASSGGQTSTDILKIDFKNYDLFKSSLIDQLSIQRLEKKSNTTFFLELHDNFYLNLCGLRALHVIMGQLGKDLGNFEYKTWAGCKLRNDVDLATGLLMSMSNYLAAFLGGADHLATVGLKDEEALRLHLNNAHLICLESKLPESVDLIAGSFFLDKLTWSMAEDIWATLLRRAEQ